MDVHSPKGGFTPTRRKLDSDLGQGADGDRRTNEWDVLAGATNGQVMEDVRPLKLATLRARIGDSTYEVDPGEVAAAILRRPEARLWLTPDGARSSPGDRQDQAK
jgi:hypothetical protein